jgi:hypothetical protein
VWCLISAFLNNDAYVLSSGDWKLLLADKLDVAGRSRAVTEVMVVTNQLSIAEAVSEYGVSATFKPFDRAFDDDFHAIREALAVFREEIGDQDVLISPINMAYTNPAVFDTVAERLGQSASGIVGTVQNPAVHPAKLFANLQAREMGVMYLFSNNSTRDRMTTKSFVFDWVDACLGDAAENASKDRVFQPSREGLRLAPVAGQTDLPVWHYVDETSARISFSAETAARQGIVQKSDRRLVGAGFMYDRIDGNRLIFHDLASAADILEYDTDKQSDGICLALMALSRNRPAATVYTYLEPGRNVVQLRFPYPLNEYTHIVFAELTTSSVEGSSGFQIRLPGGNLWRYDASRSALVNLKKDQIIQGRQELPPIFAFDGACYGVRAEITLSEPGQLTRRITPVLPASGECVHILSRVDVIRFTTKRRLKENAHV